jgi:hypothetical protein
LPLSRTASTSGSVERITAQQHAIEERLTQLKDQQNIENIRVGVENASITADENMNIDVEYSYPKPIGAKQRALMRYVSLAHVSHFVTLAPQHLLSYMRCLTSGLLFDLIKGSKLAGSNGSSGLTFEEAVRIEQEAHAQDKLRRQQQEERRRKQGLSLKGEKLSKQEMELRMWAFMCVPFSRHRCHLDTNSQHLIQEPQTLRVGHGGRLRF